MTKRICRKIMTKRIRRKTTTKRICGKHGHQPAAFSQPPCACHWGPWAPTQWQVCPPPCSGGTAGGAHTGPGARGSCPAAGQERAPPAGRPHPRAPFPAQPTPPPSAFSWQPIGEGGAGPGGRPRQWARGAAGRGRGRAPTTPGLAAAPITFSEGGEGAPRPALPPPPPLWAGPRRCRKMFDGCLLPLVFPCLLLWGLDAGTGSASLPPAPRRRRPPFPPGGADRVRGAPAPGGRRRAGACGGSPAWPRSRSAGCIAPGFCIFFCCPLAAAAAAAVTFHVESC